MSTSYTSPEYTHCIRDARFRYNVYEPEADTFLFLEALDKDADLLRRLSPCRCIEIGCGSGTVITHLRCLLMPAPPTSPTDVENTEEAARDGSHRSPSSCTSSSAAVGGPLFCAVDVNPLALEATAITWTNTLLKHFATTTLSDHYRNVFHSSAPASLAAPVVVVDAGPAAGTPYKADNTSSVMSSAAGTDASPDASTYCLRRFQGDLFSAVHGTVAGEAPTLFDIVLFNPPYVPTSLEELEDAVAKKDVITAAWCGGPRGRVVLDRFLQQLPSVMSRRGVAYIVLIKENEVVDVVGFVQRQFRAHLNTLGIDVASEEDVMEVVEVAARYTGEHLSVYRLRYAATYCSVSAAVQ
jgi:release factor glutamine methyltransferase